MRRVLIVLAASATASLAMASNFSMPSNTSLTGAQASTIPAIDNNGTPDTVSVTAVPAPGTAVMAVGGLALLARRRRDR